MTTFELAAVLLGLSALFGFVNQRWLRLPTPIGLVVIALTVSLSIILLDWLIPALPFEEAVREAVRDIDFHDTLMNGMLAFLLFAGALHVDLGDLREEGWAIGLMATVGVLISTAVVALGFSWLTGLPFVLALVFGALISPTDPVAVLGILKTVQVPQALETRIAGESLFNDGVGVVVFLLVTALAFGTGEGEPVGVGGALRLFLVEAVGGGLLGAAAGYVAFVAIRAVDEYTLETMITLALVSGTYALCTRLHLSGPIAVVVAGLFIGNQGVELGMSDRTREHLLIFWHLVDELLNAVLFLLIGVRDLCHLAAPLRHAGRARGDSAGFGGPPDQRLDPHLAPRPRQPGAARRHSRTGLGRLARGNLGGAGSVDPTGPGQAAAVGRHLCRGDLLDHRPGADGRARHRPLHGPDLRRR